MRGSNEDHYVYPLVRLNALSGNQTDATSECWLQIKQREIKMLNHGVLKEENKRGKRQRFGQGSSIKQLNGQ